MQLFSNKSEVFQYFEMPKWQEIRSQLDSTETSSFFNFAVISSLLTSVAGMLWMAANTIKYFLNKDTYFLPGLFFFCPLAILLAYSVFHDIYYKSKERRMVRKATCLSESQLRKLLELVDANYNSQNSEERKQSDEIIVAFHENKKGLPQLIFKLLKPNYTQFLEVSKELKTKAMISSFRAPQEKFKFMDN